MTVERLPEGWDLEAAIHAATDLPTLVRSKLGAGLLAAVDGVVGLATSATDERVRLLAAREVIALSQQLGAVELSPVSDLMRAVWADVGRGDPGRED
jgi:hypothetical protein